ncbi:MAG TPA: diacylglycerol kinase family lipid kinase [Syntrophales bacterium]|nr:diacylglycerol kinase family lipid kinase [Syntrophales bacterium]HOX94095.1 diacylglycerol kinase family lipid kinase [Syntrophales bacterium]HPI58005.1 diacylglycerol kinase family lipid kinase [Syntrophales bacterium]HPN25867.1 diacylglycerol kinase family lipid kinase [Syntrophales bacterium]HQM29577.1 diacylglycerol kinase family lipid kinase [Syntrophales bacterium]
MSLSPGKEKIIFVVNPESRAGATRKRWPGIRGMAEKRLGPIESCLTTGPGDATGITRRCLGAGAGLVVCVGGDGTLNEVVNGFMQEDGPARQQAVLGYIPVGTGCDFARSVFIPRNVEGALDIIARGKTRLIDLGRLAYTDSRGERVERYFDNAVSFGIGGAVVARVRDYARFCGPYTAYFFSLLSSVILEGKKQVRLGVDGGSEAFFRAWHIVAANGRFQGRALQVAPDASMDDGLLDVLVFGDIGLIDVFRHLPKLYTGRTETIKEITRTRGRKISASSDEAVLVEADGELIGRLPVEIEVVPGAVRVIAGS